MRRWAWPALVALLVLAGCAPAAGPHRTVIALLLPESKTSRYESVDRPVFERVVAERCPSCRVVYANAGQDAARQQAQAESALTEGASVLVLDAVDAAAARSVVDQAEARGVRVIAYDRPIADAPVDYLVAYDATLVGRLQAQAMLDAVGPVRPGDGILQVNGAATDPNAVAQRTGVAQVLDGAALPVLASYDTPDWSPDKAQEWVQGQLTEYSGRVVGVLAANDGTAAGAISALRAAGLDPVPPVTGQDAELAAVQRIVAGDQYMTVYKAISQQARTAAELAVRIAHGEHPAAAVRVGGVPAVLLAPVAVTRKDVAEVIVAGGVYTVAQICTPAYRAACRDLGLLGGNG
ncbi:substrate-binding domain-containing protein [Isoptericola sp. b441]|uniref:Substrate-binding domain-containing protein n=1 Tax=Actinotalea lenta TaxID=3064654 RepID=A0ABT9D6G4_9CELL|nr:MULTISPECIES: substrate-binding domain-containing protein [unclassified Isoptericola]MDO8105608.1 substrate-binding domain-containing protein [Isoptericola sp. b441]MDO8122728.1 substrate-binding domain-containing protein [Isoptericola sp. b490]